MNGSGVVVQASGGFAHKVSSKPARFETAPEKTGPPQLDARLKTAGMTGLEQAVHGQQPPSSGGVSKGARREFVCKAASGLYAPARGRCHLCLEIKTGSLSRPRPPMLHQAAPAGR